MCLLEFLQQFSNLTVPSSGCALKCHTENLAKLVWELDREPRFLITFFSLRFIFIIYVFVLLTHTHLCSTSLPSAQEGVEPLCGSWESSPGPLQHQQLLLITEPTMRPREPKLLKAPRVDSFVDRLEMHCLHTHPFNVGMGKQTELFQW